MVDFKIETYVAPEKPNAYDGPIAQLMESDNPDAVGVVTVVKGDKEGKNGDNLAVTTARRLISQAARKADRSARFVAEEDHDAVVTLRFRLGDRITQTRKPKPATIEESGADTAGTN